MSAPHMALTLAALLAATPLAAQEPPPAVSFAIVHAKLVVGDGTGPVDDGTVVVRDGKVVAAGAGLPAPTGLRTIDAAGKWVTPGLVVAVTDLGLVDVDGVDESNDTQAKTTPFSAALDIAPAINPDDLPIQVSRAGGVTRAAVAPSGSTSIFAGQGAIIALDGSARAVTEPRAFQYVELGERGGKLAGGTRVAAQTLLRNALVEARDLSRRFGPRISASDPRLIAAMPARPTDVLLNRFDAAALVPVVTGEQPLYVHVERAADIRSVLALRDDFPTLKLVIVGASEGWLVAKDLAAAKVPVLATPLNDLPAEFEQLAATQSNVGRMAKAGVKVALGAFFNQPRYAPQYAGNLVALTHLPGASGLTWGQAFAAISSGPAEAIGMGQRFGSLRPGREADVVMWDGDPLELQSGVVAEWIGGKPQDLSNHQTRLRDRYARPGEGALPKAYDW